MTQRSKQPASEPKEPRVRRGNFLASIYRDLQEQAGVSMWELLTRSGRRLKKNTQGDDIVLSAKAANAYLDQIAAIIGETKVRSYRPPLPAHLEIQRLWNTTHKNKPLSIAVRVGCDRRVVYQVLGLPFPDDEEEDYMFDNESYFLGPVKDSTKIDDEGNR